MTATVSVLWLEGIVPERMRALPSVRTLAAAGVEARLAPLPLAEPLSCYYQALTGMGPGKLGRFDAVAPVAYRAQTEPDVPEGARHRLLPDLARPGGPTITLCEEGVAQVGDAVRSATADCMVVRPRDVASASDDMLDAMVRACAEWAGTEGTVMVLTDVWFPTPRRLVNVNTFLAEAGLLETAPSAGSTRATAWGETLSYGLGAGQVWVNLRGREPQGIVTPGREYDDVRAALIAALRDDWRDPETNEPVVARVLTKEEAFAGDYCFKAPDLAVVFTPGYAPSPRAVALELEAASIQPGEASADAPAADPAACLVGRGPALASGATTAGRLVDVVPSLLYLLGMPIPPHVDGAIISDLFTPAYREQTPVRLSEGDAATLTAEEEDVIVGRLQALGYLG